MENNKIAIVLGGIQNHIHLITRLKDKGYYTILVDYLENPRAKAYADEHQRISTFDFEKIKELAIERKASLIINACIEHLNIGICKIAEDLGLTRPYSYETAYSISNKEIMKKKLTENGIPTTKYICVSSPEEIKSFDLSLPVYIKSCEGSGSNAVNRAENSEDIKKYIEIALSRYPNKKVIVEEEALGAEYNVYCLPKDGKANILMIARRITDNTSDDHTTKLIATLAPAMISEVAEKKIEEIADAIVGSFGMDNIPMFIQVMINNDEVNVIEFAGRMSGGFGYQAIYEGTGVNEFDAIINAFLEIPNEIKFKKSSDYITVSMVYGTPCIFDKVLGFQELIDDGILSNIMFPRLSGTEITDGSQNASCVAFMIHRASSITELIKKIDKTYEKLIVLGLDGEQHLRKDLRITESLLS